MPSKPTRPKNVLIIWTDEQRPDTIGAYGNRQIKTPNVDRLAAGGTLFEQAYCTQPVCSPSRASVLTGLYPHRHGVVDNNIPLPADVPTLAERLRPAGYACGYVGKWHLGNELGRPQLNTHGFDFWASTEDNYTRDRTAEGFSDYHHFLLSAATPLPTRLVTAPGSSAGRRHARLPEEVGKPAFQAAECIRFLDANADRPFMLVCNFLEPHMPFFGPFDALYRPQDMTLPASWYGEMEATVPQRLRERRRAFAEHNPHLRSDDEAGWKDLKARYWGLCSLVDKYTGRILDRLDALGLTEDTIVVYSTDHGDMMGEHRLVAKSVPYEGATHVPLIVRAPGVAPGRIRTPVSQVQLTPTLLELLGQPVPDTIQGTSLTGLLRGGDVAPDEVDVVVEWNGAHSPVTGAGPAAQADPADLRTIRRGRWKLNVHASGEHELYDLRADPGEQHNAIGDAGAAPVVRDLFDRLRAWQRQTDDPLPLPNPVASATTS